MYMILVWENDYLDCLRNKDKSIKLFEKLKEADDYANTMEDPDNVRVISIEGVKE